MQFHIGYITGAALNGASGEEVLQMFGEWGAGFAEGVSGGFLTDVYQASTGKKIEPNHALLWRAGTITGISVSFLLGMRAPTWATTAAGPLKWVAAVDMGLDIYGAGKATYDLYQSYQDNGKFEREDAWNLLNYLPFAGAVLGGAKTFLRANKNVKKSAQGIDDVLTSSTKNVGTSTGRKCFVAGTEILTIEGEKNIEDIEVGDWVIADDPTTPGEIEKRQVTDTFIRETDVLFDLYVDGEVISTTAEHAFWNPDKGWVEAEDLEVGDLLQTDEEKFVDIDRIERREGKTKVYNFSVEGIPTYFVSELGILVHNAEYFYRTMSEKEYAKVVNNGGLSIREKGSSELGITRDSNYLNDLSTRRSVGKQYGVKVQFETNDGTFDGLINMGATHISARGRYPDLPPFEKGMTVPQIKFEKNEVMSILLGKSPDGVDFFNQNITNINRL